MAERSRVYMVDDSEDIRDLYARLLDRQTDMQSAGGSESTLGLDEAIGAARADVAVVDLTGTSGAGQDVFEAIRSVRVTHPECRVIVFSGRDDEWTRARALEAGASELVSKHAAPMGLVEAIRRVVGEGKD